MRIANFRDLPVANPLLASGRRHFSQNDEDGTLMEILRRIGIAQPAAFVEFGVGNGTENNTIILLAMDWRGIWIGAQKLSFQVPSGNTRLLFLKRWITKDNPTALVQEGLAAMRISPEIVRVISVDLDGIDAHVVRAMPASELAPDVFIVEYNAKFPPTVEFELPYDEKFSWRGDDFYGISLLRWVKIFTPAGYRLVACNANGMNAFFVKAAHMPRFADVSTKIDDLYRCAYVFSFPNNGWPTSPQTILHLITKQD